MVSILIIEDDVAFSAMLKTFFEKRDYKVQTALTAEDGFKKLSSNSIDIVLTDIMLLDSDGREKMKEGRKNYSGIEVIGITNYEEINMTGNAMKNGAFDYVSKSLRPETILKTNQSALNQKESSQK